MIWAWINICRLIFGDSPKNKIHRLCILPNILCEEEKKRTRMKNVSDEEDFIRIVKSPVVQVHKEIVRLMSVVITTVYLHHPEAGDALWYSCTPSSSISASSTTNCARLVLV